MTAIKNYFNKYKHGLWIVAYMIFYMMGFFILENAGHRHYHVIHSWLDDQIPFCEYFIIPYLLWFVYLAVGVCWFIFRNQNKREYYQLISVLAIGMTIFLVVSCIYPNKQDLRPAVFANQNIFTQMVQLLYKGDTPTNILPSIHVFNSLVMFYAVNGSEQLKKKKGIRVFTGILTVSIVLSTMFLKQHSVVDVSLGILMSVALQMFCERIFQNEGMGYRKQSFRRIY
ncbi:MAG: phosphatase PAP2 family protein [Lachnospiraceae bacterium]|nr:phosphatase PAP2 family protein [Lachnospiraceae bacterium]